MLPTKFHANRAIEPGVITIDTLIASGHLSIFAIYLQIETGISKSFKVLATFLAHSIAMFYQWPVPNIGDFRWGKSIKKMHFFLLWPWNVKGHSEVMTLSWLKYWCLDSCNYFSTRCGRLNALEQKLQAVECCNTREKSWPSMTSKSDPRCQMGLEMCVDAFVIVLYWWANFHQNRMGSDTKTLFSVRFHVEWPTHHSSVCLDAGDSPQPTEWDGETICL